MSEFKYKPRDCELCGTPFRPRREEEHFCCKGCEFVHGLVGRAGAAPARVVKRGWLGSRWVWAAVFFILAGFNTLIAEVITFTEPRVNGLFRLLALMFALLAISCLAFAGKGGRSSR